MRPEPDGRLDRLAAGSGYHEDPLEDLRDVAEVECVVEPAAR